MRKQRVALAFVGVAFAVSGASCEGTDCDTGAPPDVEFVGTVTTIDGALATFTVDAVRRGDVGATVVVDFGDGAKFLREGQSYLVPATPEDDALRSYVKTAGDCPGGTRNADGSAIDTGVWRNFRWGTVFRRVLLPVAVVVAVLLAIVWLLGRRQRRLEHDAT
jgi:hypothetical protein